MTNSTYQQPLPAETRKKTASGYRPDGKVVEGKIHVYPEMAAAGLWTTPTDLAKFAIEVQLSLQGKSNKVLSQATASKMVTPFIEDVVGFGFFLQKRGNAIYFGHDGADEGFRAQLLVNRDKGYGAAVMVNSDNGQIIDEIFRGIAKEYGWDDFLPAPFDVVSVEPTQLDQYIGRFQVNSDRVIDITREGKQLFMQPTQSPRVEMLAISDTEFIRKDVPIRYVFVRGENGKVNTINIAFDGGRGEAKRLATDQLIPFEQVMAGKFAEAIEAYKKIKREHPNADAVAEERINNLGYGLLRQKKINEAIAIFKANVEMYPQSANTYDSLGEAFMSNGDREQAVINYKKSLELNPKNDNAVAMLKKLGGDQH